MLARGVYAPPSQFEAWFLSGAHTIRDIDTTIAAAREAMRDVARESLTGKTGRVSARASGARSS
jgi:glutamate-1-semialdehyde 2,1-aminomutase